MTRRDRSRANIGARRKIFRAALEELEVRWMLSATAFQSDEVKVPAASSGIVGYTPAQIRAAYGFNLASFGSIAADGSGQTIAIIDAYDDPNIASDLAVFDQAFGIAPPPSFRVVNQNGGTALPGTDPNQGWEGETALDVEWVHAIAPGANILLVEANSASDSDLFAAVNYARQQPGVSVISMSWGSDDSLSNRAFDQALSSQYLVTPGGHQGITFVASSGDDGLPNFPAESPNVLAVGGTNLHLASNNTISSETAWLPSTSGGQTWSGGGGVSQEFAGRKVPDVAYNAGVGMAVYDTFGPDHGWVSVGGTSAGAPQWAALVAIADQGRALAGLGSLNGVTQTLPALYAAPAADFHDITTGSTQFQSAGAGYDLATGLGTPVANLLIPYLVQYGSSGGASGGSTATAPPAAPANLTAAAVSTSQIVLNWSLSAGAGSYSVYELINGKAVELNTYGASTTSATGSGLTAGTTYSFSVVANNAAGSNGTAWVQATTLLPVVTVTVPQNFQVTASSSTTAQLSWSSVAGATGYQVYEWNGSRAVLVATLSGSTTATTVSSLTPGSTQFFYVMAFNSTSSASTVWASVTLPQAAAALAAPVNVKAVPTSSTTATLSWTGSAGAAGYAIYYWNGVTTVSLGSVAANRTSVTISGLKPGSTTYFLVVAYNSNSSLASKWVSLTTPVISSVTRTAAAAYFAQFAELR